MRIALYWIFIVALQVIVLNHLDISAYLIPQVFIVLLISLPLHLSKMNQVIIAFGLGLLVDLFTSTPGVHASACMWMVLIRMSLLGRQDLKEHEANKVRYSLSVAGIVPYVYTISILVLFYHFYVFWLESIGAFNVSRLLSTAGLSTVLALTIIGMLEYVSFSKRN